MSEEMLDYFALPRPEMPSETKSLTDPKYPNKPQTFSLRALDSLERSKAADLAMKKIKQYIGDEDTAPEMQFPPVGGRPVELAETLCFQVATLVLMIPEQKRRKDDKQFEYLVAMSLTAPGLYKKLNAWKDKLQKKAEHLLGEEDAESTGTK